MCMCVCVCVGQVVCVFANGPKRPGFNPRLRHTYDSKNGT